MAGDKLNPKIAAIDFRESGNSRYALDQYKEIYEKVTEYNDQYRIGDDNAYASAKFMLPGTTDEIEAFIKSEGKESDKLVPSKVRFVTDKGKEYEARYNEATRTWTITITGGAVNDGQQLYAVQEIGTGQYLTLGKLNIFTYEPLRRSVTLVPVNGEMNSLDKQSVERELNRIYGKIGIEWTVNVLDVPFSYTPVNGSTFNVTGSGLFSTETNDMKAINEAFKQSGQYQEDGLYLFILPFQASDKGEVADTGGDMPLGKQFGYLFPGAGVRTIAHELGHGAFKLEHPFSRALRNSFEMKALPDNLMDYTQGTEFAKIQWDQTRAPGMVIGLFQKDKDAMGGMSGIPADYEKGIVIKEEGVFVAPDKSLIKLPANTEILYYCPRDEDVVKNYGYLYKFKIGNKVWTSDIKITSPTSGFIFAGYKSGNETYPTAEIIKVGDIVWKVSQSIHYDENTKFVKARILSRQKIKVKSLEYSDYYEGAEILSEVESVAPVTSCDGLGSASDLDKDVQTLENLQAISANSRSNQAIEIERWDGDVLKIFTLKDGQLSEVSKPLSDAQITSGEWTGEQETKIRYTVNKNGIVQVKAFGFRKDIKIAEGKEDTRQNLPKLAERITAQTNKFLLENDVRNFGKKGRFDNPKETFADGDRVTIEGAFTKIISEGMGVTTTLLKTGEIEENVYLLSTKNTTTIHGPGLLTGSFEVIAQKVTDLTSICGLAYDMAVDKEARSEMCEQLGGIKDQIAEDPATFFPVMGEILLTVASGNTSEEWQTIADENADTGKRSHLVTRGTGNSIITAMSGAALVKNLPEIGNKLTEWVKNIKKARGSIRQVMNTAAAKEYLRKFFNEKVRTGDFEEWFESMKNHKIGRPINFEIHHIFPIHLLESNKELQRILNKFGFGPEKFNGIDNAIPLQKKSLKHDITGHSSHPQYEEFINGEVNKILGDTRLDDLGKFERIQELISDMKNKLETDVLLGNKNVNEIISW